jgi:hypothetical protein
VGNLRCKYKDSQPVFGNVVDVVERFLALSGTLLLTVKITNTVAIVIMG